MSCRSCVVSQSTFCRCGIAAYHAQRSTASPLFGSQPFSTTPKNNNNAGRTTNSRQAQQNQRSGKQNSSRARRDPPVHNGRSTNYANMGMSRAVTQLPLQQAMIVTNNNSHQRDIKRRSEYWNDLVFGPTSPSGMIYEIPLNPASITFKDTMLQKMAQMYQKYRFRRIKFQVSNTTGTTNGGSIVVAYCENPDQQIGSLREIYNFPGSKTFPLWMPADISAQILDPKFYNIDDDSEEIMLTTQGKFVFGLVSAPNTTGDVHYPVMMDYEIEFFGTTTQSFNVAKSTAFMPAGVIGGGNGGHGKFCTITPESGYEWSGDWAKNAGYTPDNPIWQLSTPFDVKNEAEENVTVFYIRIRSTTPSNVAFSCFINLNLAREGAVDTSGSIQVYQNPNIGSALAQMIEAVL